MVGRKRYVVAGTGGRGIHMFAKPLLKEHTHYCELVGLFDHNPLRLRAACKLLGADLPTYTDFQEMLAQAKPDAVVVTTTDATHAQYIVQTMAARKRAISEKPLCVNARQCREILAAKKKFARQGGACFVTHNMRYGPAVTEIKRLLASGAVGAVKSVLFQETLDRRHGADYFRRWHRFKKNSGGLLLQKASHHFDTLNWLVGSQAETLTAQGGLLVYGRNGPYRHTRCDGCPHAARCDFYADLWQSEGNRLLYKDAEAADGYMRDGCVFEKGIDIEDSMGVLYQYKNGVQVTYNLIAFASYEGYRLEVEGTGGRLEFQEIMDSQWAPGTIMVHGLEQTLGERLVLISGGERKELPVPKAAGEHGGADSLIRQDFFERPFDAPLTERQAPVEQAVQAVLIGHAANVSMANGSRPVKVQGLLKRG